MKTQQSKTWESKARLLFHSFIFTITLTQTTIGQGPKQTQPPKRILSTTFSDGVFSANQIIHVIPEKNRRGHDPQQTKTKKKKQTFNMPGFRARWWNFCKRGYWHLDHGRPKEALEDFNTALSIKPRDQWSARTYGLHFEEYFPQRGKGIALLELKRYDQSVQALTLSIEDATSEKALYYLKKAKLDKRMDLKEDLQPPQITISAKSILQNNRQSLFLVGKIEDDGYLKSVHINGTPYPMEPLSSNLDIKIPISGKDGLRLIHVEAKDGSGKIKSMKLPLFIDQSGPEVKILSLSSTSGSCKLELYAKDPSDIASFSINGKAIDGHEIKKNHYILSFPTHKELFTLHTADQIGNVSKTVIPYWENP